MRIVTPFLVSMSLFAFGCDLGFDEYGDEAELEFAQQEISRGALDGGNPAVAYLVTVAEVNGRRVPISECSGTLVSTTSGVTSSRAIATARHCIRVEEEIPNVLPQGHQFAPSDILVFFGSQPGPNDTPYSVASAEFHRGADLAMVELTAEGPAMPVPMNAQPIEAMVNQPVTIAGFGITAGDARDSGTKRVGTTTLLTTDPNQAGQLLQSMANLQVPPGFGQELRQLYGELMFMGNMPGQQQATVCPGDSGGASLMNMAGGQVLAGVNSNILGRPDPATNDGPNCAASTTIASSVRVDRYHDWMSDFIRQRNAEGPGGLPPGGNQGGGGSGTVIGGCAAAPGGAGSSSAILFFLALGLVALRRRSSV